MLQYLQSILDNAADLPVEVHAKLRADILRLDGVAGELLEMSLDTDKHVAARLASWGVCCLIDGNLSGLPSDGDDGLAYEDGFCAGHRKGLASAEAFGGLQVAA